MKRALLAIAWLMLAGLGGCAFAPDKPVRPTLYDFGPGSALARPAGSVSLPSLVLAEVNVSASFEGSAILYRLGYADSHQLRPYAYARWSAPPGQLVRQRLREQLGRDRLVLDAEEAAALARTGGVRPRVLRIELEEFTHYFSSQAASAGLVRLRCTLLDNTPGGEKLVGQRTIVMQRPATTADASGGVRALAAATDAAAEDLAAWLQQMR